MSKNTLYITFDGLTDPLGQSQILPYLIGLEKKGIRITILSCEKENGFEIEKIAVLNQIKGLNIAWDYIHYSEEGNVISRWLYLRKLFSKTKKYVADGKVDLIHCRSYITALIGLKYKRKHNIPFIFDMRGFWADERIDGGIWKKSNPIHLVFYNYFKRKEKEFILNADSIISLTYAGLKQLGMQFPNIDCAKKTEIIPCSVNTDLFNLKNSSKVKLEGISETDFVFIYVGSIGTWYLTKEMIDCFAVLQSQVKNAKLLILTKDLKQASFVKETFPNEIQNKIYITKASYNEVPSYIALAKAALFFIKPSFSKMASSPTKMAECWAMNIPIISNVGIGDNDLYFTEKKGGVLVSEFNSEAYEKASLEFLKLNSSFDYRAIAVNHFDKQKAIENYYTVYKKLLKISS